MSAQPALATPECIALDAARQVLTASRALTLHMEFCDVCKRKPVAQMWWDNEDCASFTSLLEGEANAYERLTQAEAALTVQP
jgi:hypothetical protein